MKINRLVLKNFSSFEDINEFDFRVGDNDKNIILIGGQNGAGKTSLFSAIKIGLYGPLAFGYSGTNTHYIQKIKEYINSKTFQKDTVAASVIIDISIMEEREIEEYSIERIWDYTKQRLEETYVVIKHGEELNEEELSYFQNYLLTVIPPGLFDFFLFDGEAVGSIFSTNTYNSYIKNALFTMCDLDVFEMVRKYSTNYLLKTDEDEEKEAVDVYNKNEKCIDEIEGIIKGNQEKSCEIETEITDLNVELEDLEELFKKAGGITEEERKIILNEIDKAEKRKNELSIEIKTFAEGLMPFFIARDFVKPILEQVDLEERSERFKYIVDNVSKESIGGILKEHGVLDNKIIEDLYDAIVGNFRPKGYLENRLSIHDLSKEQKNRVYSITTVINGFDRKALLKKIAEKKRASVTVAKNREVLRNTMSEEDSYSFTDRENTILKQKTELEESFENMNVQLEEKRVELDRLKNYQIKCYQEIIDKAQNRNIYKLTNGVSKVMKKVLDGRTLTIKQELETMIVENLNNIYRKNNLITLIEIDEDFKFNLYQNEIYSALNLFSSMKNYGNEEFRNSIGKKGESILYKYFNVKSLKLLRKSLEQCSDTKQIELYKKVELSRISKGERQIFILSLYWAIIKISGQKIPFIIDTPYARIDARHRKAISKKFFPNISEQVIILSTDEEINEEYYRTIKPFIAKEYLLSNDENENRTTISNKYFYEV